MIIRQLRIGGAESQTFELAKGLDKDKFEVVVCALEPGGYFAEKLKAAEIPVYFVAKHWRYDFTIIPRLIAFIRNENPDIVHCWMWTANIWGGLASKLSKTPKLLLSTRNIGTWKKRPHYLLGRLLFNRADLNLANSSEVRNYMIHKEGISPDLIRVVHNGVDLSRYIKRFTSDEVKTMRLSNGLPGNGLVVGIVANLAPRKDYPTFLRAAQKVIKARNGVSFLVVGEGELRSALESEARKLGLDGRIVFAGRRQDVECCLACMDVFVISSQREGFSNALLEAMAMGLPVVASRVGGNVDAVQEGQSGFLFEIGNDEELAMHLLKLINNPEQSKKMGELGRQMVMSEFGMGNYIQKMETIYSELLEN